jgi:hypothetical protein
MIFSFYLFDRSGECLFHMVRIPVDLPHLLIIRHSVTVNVSPSCSGGGGGQQQWSGSGGEGRWCCAATLPYI